MSVSRGVVALVLVGYALAAPAPQVTTSPEKVAGLQGVTEPCAQVNSIIDNWNSPSGATSGNTDKARIPVSLAKQCLDSVPLNVFNAQKYLDYYLPYLNLQSTLAYLKDPPKWWTLDAVDVLGGVKQISKNIKTGYYKSEYDFEADVYFLIMVLPRDFHFSVPLPLMDVFTVELGLPPLVSVSIDGKNIPQVYVVSDLYKLHNSSVGLPYKPSPIKTINGEPAADFMLHMALDEKQYHDPDAIYNLAFTEIPLKDKIDDRMGQIYSHGFNVDKTTWTFQNGTTKSKDNYATVVKGFTNIKSGKDVYEKLVLSPSKTTEDDSLASAINAIMNPKKQDAATPVQPGDAFPSQAGFPVPVLGDPAGKTAGYYLKAPNDNVAVLDITGFENEEKTEINQVTIIWQFLKKAKADGKTKMVVDLQHNGGGLVGNGYKTFSAFFPSDTILGAARQRSKPMVNFFSNITTAMDTFKTDIFSKTAVAKGAYSLDKMLDKNTQLFKSPKDWVGPNHIHDDDFTAIERPGKVGKGEKGGSKPDLLPEMDIILLQDGTCGSTCALFSQLMKSQGGVRSIAVGGRAKAGPMQGVAGSKGAQVLTHKQVQDLTQACYTSFATLKANDIPFPSPQSIPQEYKISLLDPPIGTPDLTGRFNLKNNYNSTNADEVPLEFVYEATNCRIYFEPSDVFDIAGLWARVADHAWGGKQCVEGSTTNKDGSISGSAYDTVPFSDSAKAGVKIGLNVPTEWV
ncbi:hypothetical protein HYALB_00011080 [Hymenoscyphus albidus]|uniref:Tail specific protease domain-containing protein n=1 Tax=Hymenoscyphus albidus TaxID=595503 RepID=A0A9N9QB00_9HELO|nr:hypothetical protein HYALB_00011080 [Hymenoscyphus albidus]